MLSGGEAQEHGPPGSLFSGPYEAIKDTAIGEWFGFKEFDAAQPHSGMYQFEGMCFGILVALGLSLLAIFATRGYQRVPGRFRNFLEMCVEALRGLVRMLMGPEGDKHLPFLGTLFTYILVMNLLGLIPLFRSPTMALSITGALGLTTFFMVQYSGIRANGIVGYVKHLMGPVVFLAPLMLPIELLGEMIKPVSLSLRLKGNIGGEDILIEKLIEMGGWIPIHIPILLFAVFTSFLQAFIFTALASIYIQIVTSHGEEEHPQHH